MLPYLVVDMMTVIIMTLGFFYQSVNFIGSLIANLIFKLYGWVVVYSLYISTKERLFNPEPNPVTEVYHEPTTENDNYYEYQ